MSIRCSLRDVDHAVVRRDEQGRVGRQLLGQTLHQAVHVRQFLAPARRADAHGVADEVQVPVVQVDEAAPPHASASTARRARSSADSAPEKRAPRKTERVRPESANRGSETWVTAMPAAASRSNMVSRGCHSSGSTFWSHRRKFISRPVEGTISR